MRPNLTAREVAPKRELTGWAHQYAVGSVALDTGSLDGLHPCGKGAARRHRPVMTEVVGSKPLTLPAFALARARISFGVMLPIRIGNL